MASAIDHLSSSARRRAPVNPWVPLAWFSALLIVALFPNITALVEQWSTDEDVSHGLLRASRRRVFSLAAPRPDSRSSIIIRLVGLAVMHGPLCKVMWARWRGTVLATDVVSDRAAGLLLVLGGTRLVGLEFSLAAAAFHDPDPVGDYNQITFPLQLFASQVAEFSLGIIGIPVLRDGNILELASQKLPVVEACSGIRSLLSLSFLRWSILTSSNNRVWMRWVLLLSPRSRSRFWRNSGRVTITGVLSEINPELARASSMPGRLDHFLIARSCWAASTSSSIVLTRSQTGNPRGGWHCLSS